MEKREGLKLLGVIPDEYKGAKVTIYNGLVILGKEGLPPLILKDGEFEEIRP